ncbi:MAG: sulfatase-like hydrolase/transferase [Verrucomicrobia subdivision 3 bacterium]|nr:sulfatase-like hydrolase/transferase [Limisphaerales bacterium]
MKQIILFLSIFLCGLTQAKPPNIVVILTDDQGWGDLSLNGNTDLATPHIDSLARDGARFDRFFVCAVCSPTRAEFLTGRYHVRSGVYSTSAGGERMDLDELTIADTFKAGGYATGAFGKWHNGMQYPYHPNGRGFEEYYGFCSGHWGDYFSPPLEHNGRIVQGKGFCIDDFTNQAMAFIERSHQSGKPFFAYLPYNTPHSPMQVPDRWWNKFKDKDIKLHNRDPRRENLPHLRCALAMCENIDWNVGRLLKKLDQLGVANDTIVMFFHDNGPNGVRWNGGMKGRKGSTDEGGVRSPLLVRWPARVKAGTFVKPIASVMDVLPTLADCAGVSVASKKPLDGRSLKPLLLGQKAVWKDRTIINHWRGKVSARTQRYRLDHQGKLFDMVTDPGQGKDISAAQPKVTEDLRKKVAHWKEAVLAELGEDTRPFVIAHPDYLWTQIPARDGTAHGGIKRSNKFPNCSYFSNWTSKDDEITWPVEVAASGRYAVTLHYAVPKGDEGARMQLSYGMSFKTPDGKMKGYGSAVGVTLFKPHDVPVRGHENDRVQRMESYVKDFKPIEMGTLNLKKGQGTLTLKALEIPGKTALEFRLLMLRRIK